MTATPARRVPADIAALGTVPGARAEMTRASASSSGVSLLPWSNPVFRRYFRSRLRLRKSIFWYLVTLIVTTFVVSLTYTLQANSGTAETAARSVWIPLLVLQGLILMVKGTGSVSAGLIQDKIDQTLDYQRLTPVSPLRNLVGYLVGLPVLEYAMFALTLPHLAFIAFVGRIPVGALLTVYCAFFVCAVLYHMTGIAAGMLMRKWIFGYLLSILLVLLVNVILPTFVSQLGLRFFQYFSVWPVIGQKVLPIVAGAEALPSDNPFWSGFSDVPFYGWTLSPFVFTLLLQGASILTFATMAVRRWKSSTRHSLSKPYAIALLTGFVTVLIGNVWPIVTREYMPFALFGRQRFEELGSAVAFGLPLVYSYFVWILCLLLFATIVPTYDSFVRGTRRAIKHGRARARAWDDDSGSLLVYVAFVLVAVGGLAVLLRQISAAGFYDSFGPWPAPMWRLPLALALVTLYGALLLQALGHRRAMLVVLLLWCLPVLLSTVLSAQAETFAVLHAVLHSLSPFAWLLMAGLPAESLEMPGTPAGQTSPLVVGAYTGLVVVTAQLAVLGLVWGRRRRDCDVVCGLTTPVPASLEDADAVDPSAARARD